MRKSLILLLLLLCPLSLSALSLAPEYRIAQPGFGATAESFAAIIPGAGGLVAYTNDHTSLIATPLAADGTPDITLRRVVGPYSKVAVTHGEPLLFWSDGTTLFSGRINASPHVVTTAATVQSATCTDAGCLVVFETGLGLNKIATDSEGNAVGSASPVPTFTTFGSSVAVTADPDGFTMLRTNDFRSASLIARVDRTGTTLWTTAGPITARDIVWNGDHTLLIESASFEGQWYLAAADVKSDGTIGSARPLTKIATVGTPFVFTRRGDSYAVLVQNSPNQDLYTVDRAWTTAAFVRSISTAPYFPVGLVATPASLIAEMINGTSLGTMSIDPPSVPSLLSFGPVAQSPFGIAPSGSNYVALWLEQSTLIAAHITASGAMLDRVELARDAFTLNLPVIAVGSDALAIWRDPGFGIHGAVIHPGGTFDPINLGTISVRNIVARADDWLVISQSPAAATRISRNGFVDVAKEIPDAPNAVMAAASDGDRTIVDMVDSIVVLSHDLDVIRRIPQTVITFKGSMGFSNGSYLLADGNGLTMLDRDANVLSTLPFFSVNPLTVTTTSIGWLISDRVTAKVSQVLPANPLIISADMSIPNFSLIAEQGDDRVGVLSQHYPGSDIGGLSSSTLFYREVVVQGPRRRAVMSR
jgi:hypothetical protein